MRKTDAFAPGDALRHVDILYVDADPRRRDGMRRLLLSMGVRRVQLAESADVGLTVLAGSNIGIVIAEQQPIDGIAFIRRVRDVAMYPKSLVPSLLIGESIGPDIARAAFAAGANHILVKPLSPSALYNRLVWAVEDNRSFSVENGYYVLRQPPQAGSKPAAA